MLSSEGSVKGVQLGEPEIRSTRYEVRFSDLWMSGLVEEKREKYERGCRELKSTSLSLCFSLTSSSLPPSLFCRICLLYSRAPWGWGYTFTFTFTFTVQCVRTYVHHVTLRYIIAAGVFHVRYLVVFCFLFLTCLECEDGKREKYLYLVMEWGWRRRGREIWGWANEGVGVYIYGWQLLASLLACLLLRCSRSQPSVLLLRECWGSVWCFGALVLWCVLWDLKNGIIQKNNRNIEKIYLNVIHKRTEWKRF